MRLAIRVKPGSSRARVGGRYAGSETLVVAVTARAVDGAATAAAIRAVAEAFGVKRSQIKLVTGTTARTKILDVDLDERRAQITLARLLDPSD